MKILLFGQGGQVGWELQRALAPLGEVIGLDFDSPTLHADFSRPAALAATVRTVRPDLIVNAAAHTAVDKAEGEPDVAQAINADAPGVLAREAAALGATLLHYSTDYVFDGSGDGLGLAGDGPLADAVQAVLVRQDLHEDPVSAAGAGVDNVGLQAGNADVHGAPSGWRRPGKCLQRAAPR